jgi:hypothetical protein
MRFLKSQYLSRYSPNDNTVRVNEYGRGVMDFNGGVMIPKGTTAQRPQLTGVRHPIDGNGYIRYNTDTNEIEGYVGGNWETIRAASASAITIETLGPGDATETVFGPLSIVPASANNIIVLVENVMQIPTTNFTLEQSASGSLAGPNSPYADGWYLKFTSPVPLSKNVTVFFGFAN